MHGNKLLYGNSSMRRNKKNWWDFNEQVGYIPFKTYEKKNIITNTKYKTTETLQQHKVKIKSKQLQQQQQQQ